MSRSFHKPKYKPLQDVLPFAHDAMLQISEDPQSSNSMRPRYKIRVICPTRVAERVRELLDNDRRVVSLRIKPTDAPDVMSFIAFLQVRVETSPDDPSFSRHKREVASFAWAELRSKLSDILHHVERGENHGNVHYLEDYRVN